MDMFQSGRSTGMKSMNLQIICFISIGHTSLLFPCTEESMVSLFFLSIGVPASSPSCIWLLTTGRSLPNHKKNRFFHGGWNRLGIHSLYACCAMIDFCQILKYSMQYYFLNESELFCNIMLSIYSLGKSMQYKGLAKFLTDSRYQSMALRLPRGRSLTRRPGRLKEEMSTDNIIKKQTIT